jgi:hypothetical protein
MLHDSALATTRAMKLAGVKRLIVLSAAAHFPGVPNRIASFILRKHMRIRWQWNKSCKKRSRLTIARPPRLTQGDSLTYRSREGAAPKMVSHWPARQLAFMLDALEQQKHFHKIVGIAK